jgi:hypothetical protein
MSIKGITGGCEMELFEAIDAENGSLELTS